MTSAKMPVLNINVQDLIPSLIFFMFITKKTHSKLSCYGSFLLLHQIRHRTRVRKIHAKAIHLVALASFLSIPPILDLFM